MPRLTTLRLHDRYNTTVYALDDRDCGMFGRRDILFVNDRELARLGFLEGAVVDVVTALEHAREDRIVQGLTLVSHSLPDGCCASYYPETQPLVAFEHHNPQILTPSYKSTLVQIRRVDCSRGADRGVVRAGVVGHSIMVKN